MSKDFLYVYLLCIVHCHGNNAASSYRLMFRVELLILRYIGIPTVGVAHLPRLCVSIDPELFSVLI